MQAISLHDSGCLLVFSRTLALGLLLLWGCSGGSDGGGDCDPIAATLVSRIEVTPPTPSVADGESVQLTAKAYSCDGSLLAAPTFTWQSGDANTVSVSTSGLAVGVTLGGPVAIRASAQGKDGTAQVSVVPRVVASVRVEPATATLASGRTSTLVARAFDANGRELPGRTAIWSGANDAIATVTQSGEVTGVAVGGPVAITATIEGHSGASQVTVVQAAVASVTVAPPTTTVAAGETVQLTAVLKDDLGNVLTGRAVLWTTSDPVRAAVSTSGLVTGLAPGGPVTILATSEGRSGGSQVTVTAAQPVRVAFLVQPTDVVAGAVISPPVQVEIQNAMGGRVTTSTATVTIALGANPGSSTLPPATVAAVNGVATFVGLTLNRTGTGYTLNAGSTGLAGATSSAFAVRPGDAAALAFVAQPGNVTAGEPIVPAIQVEIRDALGNPVRTASSPVTIAIGNNAGGAVLSGTLTVNAVNGIALYSDISLNRTGISYTLTADAPGLAGTTSTPFDVTPAAASRLAFAVQPSDTPEGLAFDPVVVVEVQDAFGNRVTSAAGTVTLTVRNETGGNAPSGTTLVGGGARTLTAGAATYTGMSVNVSIPRTLALRAASPGFTNVLSQPFSVSLF